MPHQINMKTLKQKIYENFKFKINRNTADTKLFADYTSPDIKTLYLIRFSEGNTIGFDIIKNIKIEPNEDDPNLYNISGRFTLEDDAIYNKAIFTQNKSGILWAEKSAGFSGLNWFDILLHPDYVEQFKGLIKELLKDKYAKYYAEDILNMLGIECEELFNTNLKNIKYDISIYDIDNLHVYFKL